MSLDRPVRVVVTGSECTGKTTLAEALAGHYGTAAIPEYARRFVDEQRRAPNASDTPGEAFETARVALKDARRHPGVPF